MSRRTHTLLLRLFAGAALLFTALVCPAAELQWPGRPFQIVASEKPLPDLLRELAASQGATAVVDPKISGTISGKFSAAPLSILNSLCATYALSWYYDGAFLYIDPSTDAKTEVISIGKDAGSAGWLMQTLIQLRIYDKRYPLLVSGREGTARVTGPRRYVDLVRQAARLVDQKSALDDVAEIRMFPLKYAWANDSKITRSGSTVSIAGVASVLRSLYGRSANVSAAAAAAGKSRRINSNFGVGADRQLKLSSGDTVNAPKVDLANMTAADGDTLDAGASFGTGRTELPQFQADTRMNAVLVRDLPQRMAQYEKLIASMDVRPRLIEIEVTIMDISGDKLNSLGVDWRAHGRHADFQVGRGTSPALNWNNAATESGQTAVDPTSGLSLTPAGGVFTAAIGNALGNYLLARVSALQQTGDANVVARPKVLTLDNNEAILENLSDFYVRVNGFQDAGLFKVTTGTAVRVTPLIIDEKSGRGVMMSVDIEDGNISASGSVDQIPIVLHRNVNTQALIDEGTSLLIAGYSSEEKTNATAGVPVLSNIPVVGNLFKYSEKKLNKQERFYLLTPRLVVPGAMAAALPAQEAPSAPQPAPTPPLVAPPSRDPNLSNGG